MDLGEEGVWQLDISSVSKLLLLRGRSQQTYIASRVIDLFLSAPVRLAYFYYNRAEENRRDPESTLNTLLQQLAQTFEDDKLLKPVMEIYKECEIKGQKSPQLSLTKSLTLFVQPIDIYPQTTICIDTLAKAKTKPVCDY